MPMPRNAKEGAEAYLEFQLHRTGGFLTALFEAISRADETNLARLRIGFPHEVRGYELFAREGLDAILEVVGRDSPIAERFCKAY